MANIRKHGTQWQARVRRNGYPTETKSFLLRTDAEHWARRTEAAIDRGSHVSAREAGTTSLREILERYAREVSPWHKGGPVERIRLKCIGRTRIGALSLSALSPRLIAAYRDERIAAVSSGTVLRELQLLSAAINHARREWGFPIANPVSAIRKPRPGRGRERRMSEEDTHRLIAALTPAKPAGTGPFSGMRNVWVKPVVLFALETAMRRSEMLALCWPDIDLAHRMARLSDTKNGHPRQVPLSSRAVGALEALPGPREGHVFKLSANALRIAFTRAADRAGLHDLHFHDLRHEATSRLFERGLSVMEVATITGHRTLQMLRRYSHLRAEDLVARLG